MRGLLGAAVMAAAFWWDVGPLWYRLIAATAALGLIALPWTRGLWNAKGIVHGVALGLAIYGAARLVLGLEVFAGQAAQIRTWVAGIPLAVCLLTVPFAIAGEEMFWRGGFLRAPLLGPVLYGASQAASGLWLLPLAALAIGAIWMFLAHRTRSLAGPIASHLVLDVLVILTLA